MHSSEPPSHSNVCLCWPNCICIWRRLLTAFRFSNFYLFLCVCLRRPTLFNYIARSKSRTVMQHYLSKSRFFWWANLAISKRTLVGNEAKRRLNVFMVLLVYIFTVQATINFVCTEIKQSIHTWQPGYSFFSSIRLRCFPCYRIKGL